jgi:hypothetical protein
MFTIIDVYRRLGFEPEKESTWNAGAAMREKYKEIYGTLPPKQLRTKTCGTGSHCFAIYPDNMMELAEKIVRNCARIEARQRELF